MYAKVHTQPQVGACNGCGEMFQCVRINSNLIGENAQKCTTEFKKIYIQRGIH